MGSKQWEDIGAERGSEQGRMFPEQLTIVGLDVAEEHLLKQYPTESRVDQNARAAISSCRDETRLAPPPRHWIEQLALGSPPPIECYRLPPDCRGKLWVPVFKGRHRTMGVRELNKECRKKAERQKVDILLLPLRAEKMTRAAAVIAQVGSNNFIPESLETRADRAAEMVSLRVDAQVIVTMLAQGGGQPVIDTLLAWARLFPLLSEEAVRQANAGTLKLGRARRLSKLRPEEQDALLQPRARQNGAREPGRRGAVSPARALAFFREAQEDPKFPQEELTLLGVMSGELPPEQLREGAYAAWNRAAERLKARGR